MHTFSVEINVNKGVYGAMKILKKQKKQQQPEKHI